MKRYRRTACDCDVSVTGGHDSAVLGQGKAREVRAIVGRSDLIAWLQAAMA